MDKYKLSQSTIEKLKYYVYLLSDPRDNKVFYVGKGKGNRINQHIVGVIEKKFSNNEKNDKIKDIINSNLNVELIILRHGLTEEEALEVESAVIDIFGKNKLTNLVKGHNSEDRGLMTLEDIKIKYEAEHAIIKESVVLININKLYYKGMSEKEIYEATRKSWKINKARIKDVKIVFAVYRGIIREVFLINEWLPSAEVIGRYMFQGEIATENMRKKYLNKSVAKYWKKGSQNPIKYVNL